MKRVPWTREELQTLIPKLEKQLAEAEAEHEEEIKPLPLLNKEECLDYFYRLMDIAAERPLTKRECFMHGQLLAVFEQQVMAQILCKNPGRYYVIPRRKN